MDSKEFLNNKNFRKQERDEIIIDIDDRTEFGLLCFMQTAISLVNAGYRIEIWYANGMKNPHIHIKNIPHLADLTLKEGTVYRKLFYEKYISKEFWRKEKVDDNQGEIPDFSICNSYEGAYHPIAEENKPHHKYGTVKMLRSVFNDSSSNFVEIDLWHRAKEGQKTKNTLRLTEGDFLYQKIASKISILFIADSFGLSPIGKKLRVCPFHADNNPSLSLNEELGLFHCFGCRQSGNIIKFYALLKKINPKVKLEVKK